MPPRGTVPDCKSAMPSSVHAIKRHQILIASQHRHPLDSIVCTLNWCSYCMPQAGTVTKSYCTPLAGTLTNSYCTPQAGTITKSYCTPAGTLTNSYCTPQASTATNKKPGFVFLFCHPNKGHSVFCNLFLNKKNNNLFLCVCHLAPVVHLPLTCLRSSGVCHRNGSLAVYFFSSWRSWRSARGCFIPLQKLIVASPLEWALISSPVLQAD